MKHHIPSYFKQETERLLMRPLTLKDIDPWKAFFINNSGLKFVAVDDSKPTEHLAEEWVTRQMQRYEEDGLGMLAVVEKASSNLIGLCGLLSRNVDGKKEMEIAYSFIPAYWGKGYATEVAQQMHAFGKAYDVVPHFISMVHTENIASMNVAKKNGMKPLRQTVYMDMNVVVYGTASATLK
jgi:ribosomal-protein-alanine N-acetyltransferase